jgi:hypothetical protein
MAQRATFTQLFLSVLGASAEFSRSLAMDSKERSCYPDSDSNILLFVFRNRAVGASLLHLSDGKECSLIEARESLGLFFGTD